MREEESIKISGCERMIKETGLKALGRSKERRGKGKEGSVGITGAKIKKKKPTARKERARHKTKARRREGGKEGRKRQRK